MGAENGAKRSNSSKSKKASKGESSTATPFKCSTTLDKNSLDALMGDDEDHVRKTSCEPSMSISNGCSSSGGNKQKQPLAASRSTTCAVCGDTAVGIWFKTAVCTGCKIFFRRVISDNKRYSCRLGNNACPIDKSMRNGCRACRFKRCCEVGMECTELNVERRRKRKLSDVKLTVANALTPASISDPLIRDLMWKEESFLQMLSSSAAPIHTSLADALSTPSTFNDVAVYQAAQLAPNDQMSFSYWRAKILSTCIEWAKSFSEFQQLDSHDQEALIVHTSFSNLVLSEAFHTPERYTDRIVFPDGLAGFRNLSANVMKERCGLMPTVVAVINNILVPIRRMQMTSVEYTLLQALLLFDSECLSLSENAITVVQTTRTKFITSLKQHLDTIYNEEDSAYRFAALLLRLPAVIKCGAYKRETLTCIETFNIMVPHPLAMAVAKRYSEFSFF